MGAHKIFYPIHIDRWRNPIATLLREIAIRIPDIEVYSYSRPETSEDRELGKALWSLNHVKKLNLVESLMHRFTWVHHASATPKNLFAVRVAKMRSLNRVVHIFTANVQPHSGDPYFREYCRAVALADVVVAVSRAVAQDLEHHLNRRVDAIIPNGVDLGFFTRSKASPVNLKSLGVKKPYVLFCAVLSPRKRPDIFINLAKLLPHIDFVMVGGAYSKREEAFYLEMARNIANVKYLGRQPRSLVRDLMAEAEALVFPSEIEGLPLTVLEALAMGLPVLAQARSSLPEVVIQGQTGWLLSGDSLGDWVAVLQDVLSWTESQRIEFEKRARCFVETHFSWNVIAVQYHELYMKFL